MVEESHVMARTNRSLRFGLQLAAGVALAGFVAGCSAPQAVAFADACAAGKDGSSIAVPGYITASGAVSCSNIGGGDYTCSVDLVQKPGDDTARQGAGSIGLDVAVGGGSDQMDEPPDDFTPDTLKIRADDGSAVTGQDHVTVSGKVSVAQDVCFVTVDKIVKG
jgi:hypothetical protein